MNFRISPFWWPGLLVFSPFALPWLYKKNITFKRNRERALARNQERIESASLLELPELDFVQLTVLVEWYARKGFLSDAAVSCLFTTNLGAVLMDVGFGPTRPALAHNAEKLGFHMDQIDGLVISHLHPDHMGGVAAQKRRSVTLPESLMPARPKPCFLPEAAQCPGFEPKVVKGPMILPSGMATTGPLARSLFFFGYTEEQALVAKVKGKGLFVFTGCGHPTLEVILEMTGKLSRDPVFAIGGGLHFPISDGRGNKWGIRFQTIAGTGKPPWKQMTDRDLDLTLAAINDIGPNQLLLSGHDVCDHSLDRIKNETRSQTLVLEAGKTYRI